MQKVQRSKSKVSQRKAVAAVPRAPESATPRTPGEEHRPQSAAIDLIIDATPAGEGMRILDLGASGKGKTFFALRAVKELQRRRMCSTAIILDLKDPERPQYDGELVHSIDEARRVLLEEQPPFLVCRPGIAADEAAQLAQDAAEAGEKVAFFADEMMPVLRLNKDTGEPTAQVFAGPALTWLQLQGRGLGATSFLLVNLPRLVPGSALDNATAYVCFGMGGRSLEYSLDLRLIPRQAASIVAKLERGECCVFFPDREWDGIIYGPG